MERISTFILVGVVGFLLDYSLFTFISHYAPDFVSRAVSFSVALFTTWVLNRRYTFSFAEKSLVREFFKYVAASKFSVFLNYVVFILLVALFSFSYLESYVFATALSSVSNYLLYRSI